MKRITLYFHSRVCFLLPPKYTPSFTSNTALLTLQYLTYSNSLFKIVRQLVSETCDPNRSPLIVTPLPSTVIQAASHQQPMATTNQCWQLSVRVVRTIQSIIACSIQRFRFSTKAMQRGLSLINSIKPDKHKSCAHNIFPTNRIMCEPPVIHCFQQ